MKFTHGLFAFVCAALSLSITALADPSYPLTCRGGAGTLGYNVQSGNAAVFYFTKSSQPSGAGLSPGQCSWQDRAINADEPACLIQNGVTDVSAWMFPNQMNSNYFSTAQAPWLRNLISASNFQTFQVYNPHNVGCFVVTRLGS